MIMCMLISAKKPIFYVDLVITWSGDIKAVDVCLQCYQALSFLIYFKTSVVIVLHGTNCLFTDITTKMFMVFFFVVFFIFQLQKQEDQTSFLEK